MSIIEIDNASYKYADSETDAVNNVTLIVEQGEFLAVLGTNGSGKSTLAKMINALYLPTGGTVRICGCDTKSEDDSENAWKIRSSCGMVFQNPDNQLVATIVEEDVAFGLENLGVESFEIRERVKNALKAVNMSEYAAAAPHMLSGGQKQRIAIAGVVAMKPKIIVFDESTAMLDPIGRKEINAIAHKLNKEDGITIIWITHFMEEAAQADRIVVMDKGSIVMEGEPRQVFSQTEKVNACGLDVPEMTALAKKLKDSGIEIAADIMDENEMTEALKALLMQKTGQ